MKKAIVIVALALTAIALMGCPSVNIPMATGTASIEKVGQSGGTIILGLFGTADSGIYDAAKKAGITKVATVDTRVKMMLGPVLLTFETTVTGE
jgi:ABC-type sugar transport system substrate-binding protein